jgi:uncharacterized protein
MMQYRKFGKLDWKASALGFGAMRLPTLDTNTMGPNINEKEAIRMIRSAIDSGVNYVDTAYVYHAGRSEIITGRALKDGYRRKAMIATKLPVWNVNTSDDFDRFLDEQLTRLETDHIDFYLFHALGRQSWKKVAGLGLIEKAETARAAGKIGHIGFSFHDEADSFIEIVDGYAGWEFCQIQYNYMDTEFQAGKKGLEYAASKGLAVIVMEPVRGGRLATPPPEIEAVFNDHPVKRSPAEWALQWVWNHPEVSMLLSGMTTMEQVEQNLVSASRSSANSFSKSDHELIQRVSEKFLSRASIPCTACGYCMPCPSGVNIPRNFTLFNDGIIYGNPSNARVGYNVFFEMKERALNCTRCKTCDEKCPQKIAISEMMPNIHAVLGKGKPY